MIHWELATKNFFKVGSNVPESEMEALKRLELGVDPSGQRANGNVADIAEQMFNTYLFCLLSFDYRWCMDKSFGSGGPIL